MPHLITYDNNHGNLYSHSLTKNHKNQALVLVNYNNANGKEILSLARHIQKIIKTKYDINLETEVNII